MSVFFFSCYDICLFQVGYESPHPHMRVPGLPASLQSAASGKPWVSSSSPAITLIFTCSLLTAHRSSGSPLFQLQHQRRKEKFNHKRFCRGKCFSFHSFRSDCTVLCLKSVLICLAIDSVHALLYFIVWVDTLHNVMLVIFTELLHSEYQHFSDL